MNQQFSYRHLYYFWVVAKEGGIARAAKRLGIAVQTVSAQVRDLERELGVELLRPAGRGVALTEAGRAAMREADQIFPSASSCRRSCATRPNGLSCGWRLASPTACRSSRCSG